MRGETCPRGILITSLRRGKKNEKAGRNGSHPSIGSGRDPSIGTENLLLSLPLSLKEHCRLGSLDDLVMRECDL